MKELLCKYAWCFTFILFGTSIIGAICSGCAIPITATSLAFAAAVILCSVGSQCGSIGCMITGMTWSCVSILYTYIILTTPWLIGHYGRLLLFSYFELGVFLFWTFLRKHIVITPLKAVSLIVTGIAPVISILIVRRFAFSDWFFMAIPIASLILLYVSFRQIELKGGVDE